MQKLKKIKKIVNFRFAMNYFKNIDNIQQLNSLIYKNSQIIFIARIAHKNFFQRKRRINYLFLLLFAFILNNKKTNYANYVENQQKKKAYQSCQKCSLQLCFFDLSRKIKCNCLLIATILQKIVQLQNYKILQTSHILLRFSFSKYCNIYIGLESDYYKSILCTIKDEYSNEKCTIEQMYEDTKKQLIILIGFTCVTTFIVTVFIESIKMIFKTQFKLMRARSQKY
ncbi:unnamed protein product [Paramecium sonneborni]|uniref:Transmembrane protein n=1 Tax=Paramecium sonneborni TaxID=65129 RepID=A0A8S1PH26_9CILI|nr:unnamed protein product [Paramecium sonneborni]